MRIKKLERGSSGEILYYVHSTYDVIKNCILYKVFVTASFECNKRFVQIKTRGNDYLFSPTARVLATESKMNE